METFYAPANELYLKLVDGHGAGAAQLAHWKANLAESWAKVGVRNIDAPTNEPMMAGNKMKIFATVDLGPISPDDVLVEIYTGPLDANGTIVHAQRTEMVRTASEDNGAYRYVGSIVADTCGQQGFAIRVLPKNSNVELRLEPGLIRWG